MIPSLLTDTITTNLDRALHYVLLWGLEGVELRSVGRATDRIPFVNESKLRRRLQELELPAVAVVPGLFEGDVADRPAWMNELAALEETLQFCRRMDCPRVVVSSFSRSDPDVPGAFESAAGALRQAGRRGNSYGVEICVLNESRMLASTGGRLSSMIELAEDVSAAWSPAEAVVSGENPLEGLGRLSGKIALVRCRNGEVLGNGWEPRTIDKGEIDWLEQIRQLESMRFDGPISLELSAEPRARQGLQDATKMIEYIRHARREGPGR
jgi:sugar phosphate isomerase/epimerase